MKLPFRLTLPALQRLLYSATSLLVGLAFVLSSHPMLAQSGGIYSTPGLYTYTVPAGGPYQIRVTARGGDGGSINPPGGGGSGASVGETFTVQSGDVLTLIVGQSGGSSFISRYISSLGGGGGGTAVVLTHTGVRTVLIAAGGGGGATSYREDLDSERSLVVLPGGGGQGLGPSAGGAGRPTSNFYSGSGGGGGLTGPGGNGGPAGNGFGGGGGGGAASLTAVSPGGTFRDLASGYGGSGFGGGGGVGGYDFTPRGFGGGGGGYGGGNAAGAGLETATGGYSYVSPTGSATTLSPGSNGTGTNRNGLVTLSFPNNIATATFSTTNQSICSGTSATLEGTVSTTGSWTLILGDGTVSTGSGSRFSIPVSPVTSTTYTIASLIDQRGFPAATNLTSTATVTVNPLPIVSLTSNGPLSCAQPSVTLTASGGSSYTFTNGTTILPGDPASNTRTISQPGTYNVLVKDSKGCSSSATTFVRDIAGQSPAVTLRNISGSDAMVTCRAPVNLLAENASSNGLQIVNYTFLKGDSIVASYTADNPTVGGRAIAVNSQGYYTVRVTAANSCTSLAGLPVYEDLEKPFASIRYSGGGGLLSCTQPSVILVANNSPGYPISYRFFRNEVLVSAGSQVLRDVTTPGIYTAEVTRSRNGCTSTASLTVTVEQDQVVTLTNNGPLSCDKPGVTLTASGGSSYTFTNGTTVLPGDPTSNTRVVTSPGTYSVVAALNSCTNAASTTVGQSPTPLTVSLTNNGPISCAQPGVTLTASGGSSYTFTNGTTILPGDPTSNTRIVTSPGTYSVVVRSLNGCTNTATTTVSQVGLTVSNPATTSVVVDQVVNQAFTASGSQRPYSFSVAIGSLPPGLSLSNTGQLTGSPTQAGSFTAVIQATDANGCSRSGLPYVVSVAPFSITSQPGANLVVCAGDPVSVSVGVLGRPTAYQWYKDNTPVTGQTSATLALASASPADAGSYVVVITGGGLSLTSTAVNLTVRPSVPARLYVNASATGANTGLDWANAFTDLQSALSAGTTCGNNLREIWVAGGVYKPTPTANRNVFFQLRSGVALYGGFVGNETALSQRPSVNPNTGLPSSSTLSGDIGQPGNALDNSLGVIVGTNLAPTTGLDGFVITGGRSEAAVGLIGGGLTNGANGSSSSPTLTNLFFTNNYSPNLGGAILNYSNGNGAASPTISNCRFEQNTAGIGGAVANASLGGSSVPVIANCYFQGNSATNGGAIVNIAQGAQGSTLSLVLTNCAFQSNSATQGGALWQGTAQAGVLNALIINCSFGGNRAGEGGALYNATSAPGSPAGGPIGLTLVNSVLFDNGGASTLANTGNVTLSARYSLLEASVTGYTDGGNNRTTASSPFASPTSLLLGAGSPAINAGDNGAYQTAGGPPTDLAGNSRIQQTTIDLGAYEGASAPTSDLSLLLFAQPTLVYGPTTVSVVVSVYELGGVATSGPVSVKLSEDTMLSLGVDPAVTSVGGKPVQNALWRFSGPVDGMYTLTSTQPLPAGGRLSVGLSGPLTPGATKGKLSVSATVVDPSGTETKLNNNMDAETIEYFKK